MTAYISQAGSRQLSSDITERRRGPRLCNSKVPALLYVSLGEDTRYLMKERTLSLLCFYLLAPGSKEGKVEGEGGGRKHGRSENCRTNCACELALTVNVFYRGEFVVSAEFSNECPMF